MDHPFGRSVWDLVSVGHAVIWIVVCVCVRVYTTEHDFAVVFVSFMIRYWVSRQMIYMYSITIRVVPLINRAR